MTLQRETALVEGEFENVVAYKILCTHIVYLFLDVGFSLIAIYSKLEFSCEKLGVISIHSRHFLV